MSKPKTVVGKKAVEPIEKDNAYYEKLLHKALDGPEFFPETYSKILDFLYLGGENEAKNLEEFNKHGFTHVINCSADHCPTGKNYYAERVKYLEFHADDRDGYDMLQHFDEAYKMIEEARMEGGKVLLHCIIGVNRSGCLATAYCMLHLKLDVIKAAVFVKDARGCLLTNESFQKQLIVFAREKGTLPK